MHDSRRTRLMLGVLLAAALALITFDSWGGAAGLSNAPPAHQRDVEAVYLSSMNHECREMCRTREQEEIGVECPRITSTDLDDFTALAHF